MMYYLEHEKKSVNFSSILKLRGGGVAILITVEYGHVCSITGFGQVLRYLLLSGDVGVFELPEDIIAE
ncbi:MAG: hypothetical protein ACJA2S_001808 [Cyclobacteriaceae bacterium]|jgi:hypothetical protein